MRVSRVSNERGIALPLAIFALVVIGALVAGTFYAGRLEQQTGQNSFYSTQAAEAAQGVLTETVHSMTGSDLVSLVEGAAPTPYATVALGGGIYATPSIQRLTPSVWFAQAVGERRNADGNPLASRTVGQLIRLNTADIDIFAGLTALGKVTVTGNSEVSGYDQTPDAWAAPPAVDCPPEQDVAGVRYNGQVTQQGSAVIKGQPNRDQDNSMTKDNMLGNTTFEQLKALTTLTLTGNVSGLAPVTVGDPPRCNISIENNWGAPTDKDSPCFDYFPVVYHYGDLSISGTGAGQGILLVEGNLDVQGRIDFYGPVIATGSVDIRGTGSDDIKFYGGVVAQDVTLDDSKLSGNAEINYSSCAIKRAIQGSALPIALQERSWVQVY